MSFTLTETPLGDHEEVSTIAWVRVNPDKNLTREEWELYKSAYEELFLKFRDQNEKFSLIFDTRGLSRVPPTYLLEKVRLLQKLRPLTEKYLFASSVVVTSDVLKRLIDFVMNIYSAVRPLSVVATVPEAFTYVTDLTHKNFVTDDEDGGSRGSSRSHEPQSPPDSTERLRDAALKFRE